MKKSLHVLIFSLLCTLSVFGQTVFEDFEGGAADISWAANNGLVFEGPIANPAKDSINNSDNVGKMVNNGVSDFCFALGTLANPANLSVNNVMTVKIWAPYAPTRALIKMEGGGASIEKFITITEANKWVKYSVDFSVAKGTMHTKILLAMDPFNTPQSGTFYIDDVVATKSTTVFETFETGNEMGWQGLDGMLEAPVDNPTPNSVNMSAKVGKYTKSNTHAYSLLLAESPVKYDLSVSNQIKISVLATRATQILMKLEGPNGPSIERSKNIGLKDKWQEYTFDFSAAKDYKHITKMILFFDQGVDTSGGVYYFDNIYSVPAGPCDGVTLKPDVLDDFECNRNATYVNGWDSLTVVPNPSPNPVNMSSMVGKYVDPLNEEYAVLLMDFQNPLDLSEKNQFNVKIWAPKTGNLLFKLEGGASPGKEISVPVTDVNQWVNYSVDFSSEALNSHKKAGIFFNAGKLPAEGDVYYIDSIYFGVKVVSDLENFENGASLPWEPLDQLTALHGTFDVIDNPDKTGLNTSAKVGKYVKGSSTFSTVAAVAPGLIDISTKPQYNLDVWAPEGSTSVTFQLESVTDGNKEVERDIKTPGEWETISFNFEEFQATTDWSAIKIIFNPNVAEAGKTFYFDNLRQSTPTVDACENAVPITNIIDDFECQRNYSYGAGSAALTVVNNPNTTGNASTKVGLYKDPAGEPYAALCVDFPEAIDLNVFNQLELQVLATAAVPVLLKLEGGSSPSKEIMTQITTANSWNKLSVDFSGEAGNNHKRVCMFMNAGAQTTTVDNYYIDNIKLAHAPYNGCLMNFDDAAFTSLKWSYFPNDNAGGFELVDNPMKSGINTSAKVGKAIEKSTGEQPWQGMYADLDSYIDFGTNKVLKMKVLSPKVGGITMKVEGATLPDFPGSGDNTITNTKANEWEEVSFDFATSPTPIDEAGQYKRITLIWDITVLPETDVTYYFDDIVVDGGSCGQTVGFNNVKLDQLEVMPNPVSEVLTIQNAAAISRVDIYNMYGQKLGATWNTGEGNIYLNVSKLLNGSYFIMGYDSLGRVTAQSRFIKM